MTEYIIVYSLIICIRFDSGARLVTVRFHEVFNFVRAVLVVVEGKLGPGLANHGAVPIARTLYSIQQTCHFPKTERQFNSRSSEPYPDFVLFLLMM